MTDEDLFLTPGTIYNREIKKVPKYEKGQTAHIHRGPGKPYKIHILAVVDDVYVVFRWYGRHKQWWHYQVEHEDILETWISRCEERNGRV
jgi:hypothetical protein